MRGVLYFFVISIVWTGLLFIHLDDNFTVWSLDLGNFYVDDDYYRMITSHFTHFTLLHLFVNGSLLSILLFFSYPSRTFIIMVIPFSFVCVFFVSHVLILLDIKNTWAGMSALVYGISILSILYSNLLSNIFKILCIMAVFAIIGVDHFGFFGKHINFIITLGSSNLSSTAHFIAACTAIFYFLFTEAYDKAYST
jgi:membrane associated rhomboid family serine protease